MRAVLPALAQRELSAEGDAGQIHATEPVPIGKRRLSNRALREIATMAWYRRARFGGISNCDQWAPGRGAIPQPLSIKWPEI